MGELRNINYSMQHEAARLCVSCGYPVSITPVFAGWNQRISQESIPSKLLSSSVRIEEFLMLDFKHAAVTNPSFLWQFQTY